MRTVAPIAALLGIAIAVRRTPIEGLGWATLTVAAAGWAVAAHRWVNGHRTATSAVVDFLRIAPLYMILFTAGSLAWNASDPVGDALSWGLMAGTISGSVSAVVDWRDRRQALR